MKEKCIECGHECCKWIAFTTMEMSGRSLEFYIARGCKVLRADEGDRSYYKVYIPHECPHLVVGVGCNCYEKRPLACVEYEGKHDPLVQGICKIEG